jgi:hypothetical protein
VPDAGVDVDRGALEGGVAGQRGVADRCGVGDAPVHPLGIARKVGTDLAGLVAQADHVVEPAAGQGAEGPGALAGDVDAEVVASTRTAWG